MIRLFTLLCLLLTISACGSSDDDSGPDELPDNSRVVLDCGDPTGDVNAPGTLSSEAKAYILCQHNEVRSETALGVFQGDSGFLPNSKNMQRMEWDSNLATVASNWAAGCVFTHNSNRTNEYSAQGGEGYVGENIYYFSSPSIELTSIDIIAEAVTAWKSEGAFWTFGGFTTSDSCSSNSCGHFTQLVWAETIRVGCGFQICPETGYSAMFVVCDYSPGGNFVSQLPYKEGDTSNDICSEGMQTGQTCQNGLISN